MENNTNISPCGTGKKHKKADTPGCTCGRPKTPLKELEVKWNQRTEDMVINGSWVEAQDWTGVVKYEYAQGASDVEIRVMLDMSDDLWERLLVDEPKFTRTIRKGRKMAEAWWTREGRTALRDKDLSYLGWRLNMANRYGWNTEKSQTDVTSNGKEIKGLAVNFVDTNDSKPTTTE